MPIWVSFRRRRFNCRLALLTTTIALAVATYLLVESSHVTAGGSTYEIISGPRVGDEGGQGGDVLKEPPDIPDILVRPIPMWTNVSCVAGDAEGSLMACGNITTAMLNEVLIVSESEMGTVAGLMAAALLSEAVKPTSRDTSTPAPDSTDRDGGTAEYFSIILSPSGESLLANAFAYQLSDIGIQSSTSSLSAAVSLAVEALHPPAPSSPAKQTGKINSFLHSTATTLSLDLGHPCAALLAALPFGVRRRALSAAALPGTFSVGLMRTLGVVRVLPHTAQAAECVAADAWIHLDTVAGIYEDPHGRLVRSLSGVCSDYGDEDERTLLPALVAAVALPDEQRTLRLPLVKVLNEVAGHERPRIESRDINEVVEEKARVAVQRPTRGREGDDIMAEYMGEDGDKEEEEEENLLIDDGILVDDVEDEEEEEEDDVIGRRRLMSQVSEEDEEEYLLVEGQEEIDIHALDKSMSLRNRDGAISVLSSFSASGSSSSDIIDTEFRLGSFRSYLRTPPTVTSRDVPSGAPQDPCDQSYFDLYVGVLAYLEHFTYEETVEALCGLQSFHISCVAHRDAGSRDPPYMTHVLQLRRSVPFYRYLYAVLLDAEHTLAAEALNEQKAKLVSKAVGGRNNDDNKNNNGKDSDDNNDNNGDKNDDDNKNNGEFASTFPPNFGPTTSPEYLSYMLAEKELYEVRASVVSTYDSAMRHGLSSTHKVWPWVFRRRAALLRHNGTSHAVSCQHDTGEQLLVLKGLGEKERAKVCAKVAVELSSSVSNLPVFHMIWSTLTRQRREEGQVRETLATMEMAAVRSIFMTHPKGVRLVIHSSTVAPEMFADVDDLVKSTNSIIIFSPLECLWLHDRKDLVWYTSFISDVVDMYSNTEYFYSHVTDFARMLALYRYGGTYVDTDLILLRSLNDVDDVIGMESGNLLVAWDTIPTGNHNRVTANGAVMKFSQPGAPFIRLCMQLSLKRYNPGVWGTIGPDLLTHAARLLLDEGAYTTMPEGTTPSPVVLSSVTVLPTWAFYPVHWSRGDMEMMYAGAIKEGMYKDIKARSYGLHMWHRLAPRMEEWNTEGLAARILGEILCYNESARQKYNYLCMPR